MNNSVFNEIKKNIRGVDQFIVRLDTLQNVINHIKEPSISEVIWEKIPAAMFYKDTSNRLLKVSNVFAEICGVKKEDIEGKKAEDLTTPEIAKKYAENDYDVFTSKQPKLNIIEPLILNSNRTFRTDKYPIIVNDEVVGILGISVEITNN